MAKKAELSEVKRVQKSVEKLRAEIGKVIVGQDEVVEQLLIAIFSRGHCIIEGVPGLAKTLLIRTLADCLRLDFNRIQFTPDLMPTDITGTEVIHESAGGTKREFRFLKGPIFANVILADEINRTPPKTQAALLESMQEGQVTVGGKRNPLPDPFFVLATQNPIEQEGTYPLPEAQQDRFLFKIYIKYPTRDEEYDIIRQTTEEDTASVRAVFSKKAIIDVQEIVRRVPIADPVVNYAMNLVRKTRIDGAPDEDVPKFVKEYVAWGAGPRACQCLVTAGKAKALLAGRFHVAVEDIDAVAHPVLRHRILTNFHAEARGYTVDKIIDELIETTPAEDSEALGDGEVRKVLRS
ncbi:MAG: MoxR family ATPase [Planctomycetota bacterium]|nr:AAA family ATPase [Planctomycetota bacterium]MBL04343.1 AAA family ATPase [Planctomycetota bacterium]MEE3054292.1 MoxR family ATPase [Planctomycetota bacterium]